MFRQIWKRLFLRDLTQTDRQTRINALYALRDPWGLEREPEQARYTESNRIISTEFAETNTILEIGSGEGLQTLHLLKIASSIQGIEVSRRAADRSRCRIPSVPVHVGTAESYLQTHTGERFNLATAFEVLYYPSEPLVAINAMNRLAENCIASSFEKYVDRMRPIIRDTCEAKEHEFTSHGLTWIFWTWTNRQPNIRQGDHAK